MGLLSIEAPVNGSSNYKIIVVVKVSQMLESLARSIVLVVFKLY